MLPLPDDYLTPSIKYVLGAVFGAGGVAMLRVWLENRRLGKKDFRELLLDRIRDLESKHTHMSIRMGNLRVEMAHLESENDILRVKLGLPRRREEKDAQNDE